MNCAVMGTTTAECRERLLLRTNHPTIDNPTLALELLDKFGGLWVKPTPEEVRHFYFSEARHGFVRQPATAPLLTPPRLAYLAAPGLRPRRFPSVPPPAGPAHSRPPHRPPRLRRPLTAQPPRLRPAPAPPARRARVPQPWVRRRPAAGSEPVPACAVERRMGRPASTGAQ